MDSTTYKTLPCNRRGITRLTNSEIQIIEYSSKVLIVYELWRDGKIQITESTVCVECFRLPASKASSGPELCRFRVARFANNIAPPHTFQARHEISSKPSIGVRLTFGSYETVISRNVKRARTITDMDGSLSSIIQHDPPEDYRVRITLCGTEIEGKRDRNHFIGNPGIYRTPACRSVRVFELKFEEIFGNGEQGGDHNTIHCYPGSSCTRPISVWRWRGFTGT